MEMRAKRTKITLIMQGESVGTVAVQAPPPISKFRDDARTDPPQGQGLPYYQIGEGLGLVDQRAAGRFHNRVVLSPECHEICLRCSAMISWRCSRTPPLKICAPSALLGMGRRGLT